MSEPQKKRDLPQELRILVASLLCLGVMLVWFRFFAPKPPVVPAQTKKQTQGQPSTPTPAQEPSPPAGSTATAARAQHGPATAISPPPPTKVPEKSDAEERAIVVESDLYRVELSNRGAVVKSWQLKKYTDDSKPPRVLDVVHAEAAQQTGGWPFALALDDPDLEAHANSGLFVSWVAEKEGPNAKPASQKNAVLPASPIQAPTDLEFAWSDGHLEVNKRIHFDRNYVVRVDVTVKLNGLPVTTGLAWLGGFGDLTVANPAPIETVSVVYSENGKLSTIMAKKLEAADKWPRGLWQGGRDWTGIQDRYFLAAFLPPNGAAPGTLEARYWSAQRTVKTEEGKEGQEPVPQLATAAASQPVALRVYVGPKDYDELKKMNPPLNALVNFGWFEFISDPLFHGLKWLHTYIPNWGWAIVVLTLILNMVLFPLRISSYRTMIKMQRLAPEIAPLNDKMKKLPLNDPKRAEIQKQVMAVYSREGINPVGGCIPQLLQFPIWLGLYRALQGTIELRHAPWFWWIKDLSAKDPFYILPVLMGVSMYFSSKMTPMTSTDPQQQAMMKFMPIGMAVMFMVIPYPSGLAVYILTSGLVGMFQQWYLNRSHPLPAQTQPVRGKKGKKRQ